MQFYELQNEYNNVRVMIKHNKHGNYLCLDINKEVLEAEYDIIDYLEISVNDYFDLFKNFKHELINKEMYFLTDETAMNAAEHLQNILPRFLIPKKLRKQII